MEIHQHPSPNFGPRRDGRVPRFVVLHYTAMASADAAIDRLCDPAAEVSAHYVICKTGRVTQLVAEGQRAWHAGAGSWMGCDDVNSASIGIELDNDGTAPFTEPLMARLEALLQRILSAWALPPRAVIGHSDLAPGRKQDPGARFDWPRLEARGLARPRGRARPPAHVDPAGFVAAARAQGYTAPTDVDTLCAAVRLRYRPAATGPLCAEDLAPLMDPP